jgi:hypothetical protein
LLFAGGKQGNILVIKLPSFEIIKEINAFKEISKFLLYDPEFLILGELDGYLELLRLNDYEIVL